MSDGAIDPDKPITTDVLNMLEPITFPMANACCPVLTAAMEDAGSGSDVPIAMIVRPMISSLTPMLVAISVPPHTSIRQLSISARGRR